MRESICYLNGVLGPLSEAKVSVLDRGFIFGDGVYELVPVFDGMAFRLPEHLGRLRRSLAAVLMDNPLSDTRWTSNVLLRRRFTGRYILYKTIESHTPLN